MKTAIFLALFSGMCASPGDVPTPADIVTLQDYAPCGTVSLYLVSQMLDVPAEWEQVVELIGPLKEDRTHSFADLSRAAESLGMHPVGLRASRGGLKDLPMPAIVQVHDPNNSDEPPHLLVLTKVAADGVWLLDAPFPAYFLPDSKFENTWTGNTLVFASDAAHAAQIRSPSLIRNAQGIALWVWFGVGAAILLVFGLWQWSLARSIQHRPLVPSFSVRAWRRPLALATVVATVVVLAFGVVLTTGRLNARADLPPCCAFEQPVLELGQLPPGEQTVPVTIRNDGDAPLHISSVQSTCSCAVVKAPEAIEPRQSVTMEIVLTVTPGPRGARITVESNDPAGAKTLVLSWHGAADPRLMPATIVESSAPLGQAYQRTLRLVYPGGKTAIRPTLERFECQSSRVQIREGKNDPSAARFANSGLLVNIQGELEIHVSVEPHEAPETFLSAATLVLKYGTATLTVPFPINVRFTQPALVPDVDSVSFSARSPSELAGQRRSIRLTSKIPSEDIEVRDAPVWLTWSVVAAADGSRVIELTVVGEPEFTNSQHVLSISAKDDPRSSAPLRVNIFTGRN